MISNNKIKILLIEDDQFLLNIYATKFKLEKFKVVLATDGEQGIKLASEENPSIILLDIMLPKMNGLDVLKKLKADKKTSKIPVVLLTNLSKKDEVDKSFALGADDYLVKAHFMPSEVVEKIKSVINSPRN